ncbi:MAG: fibronectin type III domain-containing protein, partial [Thermoguttaceae bacterium]|nr:fibronectin type III domain-containing protein [Thermoguttaceae bacterium]
MTKNQKTSLFSNRSSRRSEKRAPRSTSLRFEALENRELLSVNAADYAQLRESFEQLALPALTAAPFQNANVAAAPTLADGEVCASLLEPMWTPLTAPTLRVESTAGGVVTLAWDAVANAGGYQLTARVAGENLYDALTFEADETSVTLNDLDVDKTYEFRIMTIGSGDVYASSDYGEPVLVHVYAESLRVASYNSETRVATIEWGSVLGASKYTVKLSKDDGASWTNYKTNLTTTNTTVNGLYTGKAYAFRVFGFASNGTLLDVSEIVFAPISVTTSVQEYTVGTPITLNLSASATASATIQWFFVTNDGDVEIVSARNRLSYTPTTADYDIKVVTTGTGDSAPCVYTQRISRPVEAAALSVTSYDPETRVATLEWGAISGASKYSVKISKDGGATWANYKTNLPTTSLSVNGLYTGKAYAFRVIGIASDGTTLDGGSEVAFAPVSATASVQDYTVGTPITLKFSAAANASATVRWYFVTNNGDEEIVSARNRLSYVPTSADYDIKVVTTGTGDSAPCVYTQTIARPVDAAPITVRNYDAETRIATIRWDPMAGAATYTVKISKDGGATWLDYIKKIPSKNNYKGINGIYAGKSYDFRVYGITSDGTALRRYAAGTVAPVALSSTSTSYSVGEAITVRQTGADNASAT